MLMHIHQRLGRRIGLALAALMALLVSDPATTFGGGRSPAHRIAQPAPKPPQDHARIGQPAPKPPQGHSRIDHHALPQHQGRIVHYRPRLPYGHTRIRIAGAPYYFYGGRYYRQAHRGYVVARPPLGAVLAALPLGFLTLTIGSLIYYCHGDVYYRQVPSGYMVVEAPPEAVVVHETPAAVPGVQNGDRVTVTAQRLNVRSGPGRDFAVITIIDQGTSLEVRGSASEWLYVRLADGRFGWVQETYTTPIVPPASG